MKSHIHYHQFHNLNELFYLMILIDTYKGRSKRKEVLGKIHKTDDNRRNTYTKH